MRIGILTFHRSVNNGAVIQCYSLSKRLQKEFPDADVEVIDGGVFDVAEFSYAINLYPNEQKTNAISSSAEAVQAAIRVWHEVYYYDELDKRDGRPNDIMRGISEVKFFCDDGTDCWLVYGVLPNEPYPTAGAVPHIILKSDGTVLAVWIE